jgi:hypothetical protein
MTNDKLDKAIALRKQITSISESIKHLRNISSVAKCADQEKIYGIKVEQPLIGCVGLDIGTCANYVEVLHAIVDTLSKQLFKLEEAFDAL